ncbi:MULTISPECIES: winged helix-turn-helix transcriptional regulator [Phyllobacterium]|uniref:Transcriptional regulator n=1 Tax=Phyllobacterium sophorae TaxID=1520277 RepID=A0A2P7BCL5_9HYPH|nr:MULTISPECIES: helix-turn-helix domain-containing protein [Phyllobacterium]PSH64206.1 transcriptional regulator [Phyllobacterium sophorae]UXN63226.1 helix-turn-helix transcriptional regulator [Phyllobacterium sp. A18/5-2]
MKDTVSHCPVENAMLVLAGRWRILLIYYLLEGTKRFSDLRRDMPKISQRMLTLDLRALEAAGYVRRTVYPEVPVRVEYSLTEEGLRLRSLVDVLGECGERLTRHRDAKAA